MKIKYMDETFEILELDEEPEIEEEEYDPFEPSYEDLMEWMAASAGMDYYEYIRGF